MHRTARACAAVYLDAETIGVVATDLAGSMGTVNPETTSMFKEEQFPVIVTSLQ
jgi:hypothetical protein